MIAPNERKSGMAGGRPHKPVKDPMTGQEIPGLSWHKGSGQFYVTGSNPRKYLSNDLDTARFRLAQMNPDRQETDYGYGTPESVQEPVLSPEEAERFRSAGKKATKIQPFQWGTIRRHILEDLDGFCKKVGLTVKVVDEGDRGIPLADLTKTYDKRNKASDKTKRDVLKYWGEFVQFVRPATHVGQISLQTVRRFGDTIEAEQAKRDLSPSWVKARFDAVRMVLRFADKQGHTSRGLTALIGHCNVWDTPNTNGNDPRPISKADFQKLLEAADDKFRAVLLLSLNCALYPSEVAQVKLDELDLKARTYVATRPKTGTPRIAVLWPRTVKAIRQHLKTRSHESKYLFTNRVGGPYQPHKLTQAFRDYVRTPAKVKDSVEFAHIRDGAATHAQRTKGVTGEQVEFLLGHKVPGKKDAYVRRDPLMVADACKGIEQAYFGQSAQKQKKPATG